jgi:hypothetical protein
MMTGPEFLWRAAGCPIPIGTDGAPIPKFDWPAGTRCAATGLPAEYRMDQAVSDNFTTVKNKSRAWSFGGVALSGAAIWACRTLALRCALFFATDRGIWFEAIRPIAGIQPRFRIDALEALLRPPPPPFVAGLPLYGIDHGGESNIERAIWWARPESGPAQAIFPQGPWVRRTSGLVTAPLIKLQSKHTAIYCQVSGSSERYHLQVDDASDIIVDVRLWRTLKPKAQELLAEMRDAGVGAMDARTALATLRAPKWGSVQFLSRWGRLTDGFQPFRAAPWWGRVFVPLLPMPGET